MPMNEAQEMNLARAANANRQDKTIPLCVNIHDGRLVPNVENTRKNPNYRPYQGDPKADVQTRLKSLSVGLAPGVRVIASRPIVEAETFDVSTASKDELIVFASDNFGMVLDVSTHIATMRKQILAAFERTAAAAAAKATDDMT